MNKTHEDPKINEDAPTKSKAKESSRTVTTDRDIDFPSLNWSLNAGETRELPSDAQAAEQILLNHHISLTA